MADLPAAVDPTNMGLNITPYDNDDNTAGDRHDHAAPHRPEHASGVVDVRQRPVGPVPLGPRDAAGLHAAGGPPDRRRRRRTCRNPNLNGVDSPQTIAQSARNGVPISGRVPAPARRVIAVDGAVLDAAAVEIDIDAAGPGTVHVFLWSATKGYMPVFNTSCDPATDPAPDYGLSACALTDGAIPPWSPDMSGRVVAERERRRRGQRGQHVSIPLDAGASAEARARRPGARVLRDAAGRGAGVRRAARAARRGRRRRVRPPSASRWRGPERQGAREYGESAAGTSSSARRPPTA